jgi:hypothetical protein
MTGIWIAEEVADDHRQVIDWLIENTPDTIGLFLAELKAYTIGGSVPAPQLDVVCRPNVTMKQLHSAERSEGEIERREFRIAFWQDIHQRLKQEKLPFSLQSPGPDHWSNVALGRSNFHLAMLLTPKNQSIGVELYVKPPGWKESAFEQLKADQAAIERELGRPLDWRPMPDKASARILLEEKLDPDVEASRQRVCDWFAEWTPRMYAVFRERVRALKAPDEV